MASIIETSTKYNAIVKPRSNHTCPVDIPQNVSPACLADRQTEATQSQTIYFLRQTPDFNDTLRDPTVLIPPLWGADQSVAFGVAFSEPLEMPWLIDYTTSLSTNLQLASTFQTTGNNSLRDFTVLDDYRALFSFFYDFHVVSETL